MCAKDAPLNNAADDVWGDSDHGNEEPSGAGPSMRSTQLDREWEARKQQFYNAGFREGLEEGKEVTLQQGFNAGFAEGAQAGYEFGLVKSTLQVLAAQLAQSDSRRAKVQELLQQVSAVHARAAMVDTCKALLEQQPADAVAAHLQAALTLQGAADATAPAATVAATSAGATGDQTGPTTSSSSSGEQDTAEAAAAAAEGPSSSSGGSSSQAGSLPLPLQLVSHLKQELQQLGFSVGSAPPFTVASSSINRAAQGGGDGASE